MSRILTSDGDVIIPHLVYATNLPDRMKGLLGRSNLPADTGMLLQPCKSIHMWFMKFPIDAAFLDADGNVLKIARALQPWNLSFAPRHTHSVLETAAGILKNVQKGDQLIQR